MKPWIFCPWCSHRTYQHSTDGCHHTEAVLQQCTDPDCKPDVVLTPGGTHAHPVPVQCDCTVPFSQLT